MNAPDTITKAFSKWRIYAALLLGLGISGWLFYRSMSQVEFEEVKHGSGTHTWVDTNKNGQIDWNLPAEFHPQKHGNYRKQSAWEVIAEIDWSVHTFFWIFMALLAMVGRDLAYMWRIRILTRNELSWRRSFSVIMLWEFASALAPGVLSGATVAMFILNREKIALGRSTAIVIITAFFDNLFYVLLIPLVFLIVSSDDLLPSGIDNAGAVMTLFWTGFSIFAGLCLLLYLSLFQFPFLLKGILGGVTSLPFLRRWKTNALNVGNDVAQTAITLKTESFSFWARTFVATCSSWISRYLVINCILQAFISLGLLQHIQVLAKQLVLWMFLRISPTPGGSGAAEWAFSELLSDLTSSAILLAGMAVLWRMISYFPYLLIGSIILPRWLRRE
ncbi:MAG TPA: lysylphosphatidylglycerol synthase transmembrane domain-containing protein [Fluviicola sp.]|nr:lysylphosphatidylglycerol synthase transmembrane domain-containing protein [Fluviicola sp.]